jgi:hypothetical protein
MSSISTDGTVIYSSRLSNKERKGLTISRPGCTVRTVESVVQHGHRLQTSVALNRIRDAADAQLPVIYGREDHFLKAKGYESQSFERKHATLFNCTNPDRVSAKKRMIRPVFSSKEVTNLHAESIDIHTQKLLAIVGDGRPCDMAIIGWCKFDIRRRLAC